MTSEQEEELTGMQELAIAIERFNDALWEIRRAILEHGTLKEIAELLEEEE